MGMYTTEDVYKMMSRFLPSVIYENEDYYPIIMAMSYLIAESWNNADKLARLKDVEDIDERFLRYIVEYLGYSEYYYGGTDFSTRIFLSRFVKILQKRGTAQSIINAIKYAGNPGEKLFNKDVASDIYITDEENPWEYSVHYPIDMSIDNSLYRRVKPAGQKDTLVPTADDDYDVYYVEQYGMLKSDMDNDFEITIEE